LNVGWLNLNWIQIPKLKWIEVETIFCSFGFYRCVFIEIWIEMNLVFDWIKFNWIQIGWIQLNLHSTFKRYHL
jgi:hypothetical protein